MGTPIICSASDRAQGMAAWTTDQRGKREIMTQYALVTDLNRCVGCLACAVACKPSTRARCHFWDKVLRGGPTRRATTTLIARHRNLLSAGNLPASKTECVKVCPPTSTKQADARSIPRPSASGQVCVMAFPYGVRSLNQSERCGEMHALRAAYERGLSAPMRSSVRWSCPLLRRYRAGNRPDARARRPDARDHRVHRLLQTL